MNMKEYVSYKLIPIETMAGKKDGSLYDFLSEGGIPTTNHDEINALLTGAGYWYVSEEQFKRAKEQSKLC